MNVIEAVCQGGLLMRMYRYARECDEFAYFYLILRGKIL